MASVLEQIQAGQQDEEDQGLALAAHDASWANFYNNTPSSEKLRANLDLSNMVDRAVRKKQDLLAQTDLKAQELKANTAKFDEWQKQAPLREQLLQAHIDATGATERRKAVEAKKTADQTAALNNGMLKLYQSGVKYGTPEFQQGVVGLIADNPMAHADHIAEVGKIAGLGSGLSAEDYVSEAMKQKKLAADAGFRNPQIREVGGKPVIVEGQEAEVPFDEHTAQLVKRKKALEAVDPVKAAAMTPEQKVAASEKAIVGGTLSFGYLDDKGKLKPNSTTGTDPTDDKKATHVQSFYVDPTSGKTVKTPPMTIDEFKAFQDRAKAVAGTVTKEIDVDTAKALLQEAKGDKEAARALAKERGYHF